MHVDCGRAMLAALASLLISGAVQATDFRLTGFGTIGYARSSLNEGAYLRYIDHDGTLKADSLVGVQGEAQFNPEWGATVQAVASAPRTRDNGYETKVRWAFVSYRPDNDWLLRVGRVRPPFFINTQNAEVGVTFDQARLPAEIYTLSPVYDLDGAAVGRTWAGTGYEFAIDGYWGKTDIKFRDHYQIEPPATYFPERITVKGLVLSYATGPLLLRGGIHNASLKATGSEQYPREIASAAIPAPPPIGGPLYVPAGIEKWMDVRILILGIDWRPDPWRVTFEYGKREAPDSNVLVNDQSAYATISRRFDKWTPYATYARMLSSDGNREIFARVNAAPVPLAAQDAPFFLSANYHRFLADRFQVFDQYSTMLGASYSFSPTSKLKLEWMRTRVGLVSTMVDGDVHNRSFNVLSASYSVAF